MHSTKLKHLQDYLQSLNPLFSVVAFTESQGIELYGIESDRNQILIRPNTNNELQDTLRLISKPHTYEVTKKLTLIAEYYNIENNQCDIAELFAIQLMNYPSIIKGIGYDTESIYKSETGKSLKDCDIEMIRIDFDITYRLNQCKCHKDITLKKC